MKKAMVFVVLGMHKSGTTLLARALHESGIVMGQDFPAGVDYTKAKYEACWVQEITTKYCTLIELSMRVTSKLLPVSGVSVKRKGKDEAGELEKLRCTTHNGVSRIRGPH